MDFKNWSDSDKKRLVEHNKNDVLALYEIIQKWRIAVFQVAKVDPISEISMSKLSLKSYRVDMRTNSFIPMHKTDLVNPKRALINPFLYPQRNAGNDARTMFSYRIRFPEYEFTRDAYFGGKCEVYDTNTLENHAYFDRNSMYPKVMFDKFYPIGLPKFSKDKAEIWRIIKNKDERLAIIRVKITPRKSNNFPLLPIRLEQKVMFTNHTRIWNYTFVELHEAWKDGAKIKIVKALIFPGKSQIFRGYISKMYEFRKKFSLEKDAGKNKLAKKLMNTLYGKFGERMVKKQMQYKFFKNREDCVEFAIQKGDELKDEMSMLEKKYQLMPYIRFKERPETKGEYRLEWIENRERAKPFMLTHLAVFVTSYARINLWKLQNTLAKQGILTKYCDTDSLVVKLKYKDKLPLGKELGDWKIEKEFKRVKFLAPKAYIGMDKNGKLFAKLKGLDKFAMKKILSQCIFLEELEQKIRKRIAIDEMYMKYSQSCHYGEILCSKTSTKMFKFENLKRKFDKETGLSEPYNDGNLPEYLKIPEKAL